jgi:signal transduction histidine kinase
MEVQKSQKRTISARQTLIGLLLIPLLSLAGLWMFTLSVTLTNVDRNQQSDTIVTEVSPSAIALFLDMGEERGLTLAWLVGDRNPALRTALTAARRATDATDKVFRPQTASIAGLLSATGRVRLSSANAEIGTLGRIRAAVDAGADGPQAASNAYGVVDNAIFGLIYNSTPVADPTYGLMLQTAIADARGSDLTASAAGLIEGGIFAGGHLTDPERIVLGQLVAQQNLEIGDAFSQANPQLTPLVSNAFDSIAYQRLTALESKIVSAPAATPIGVSAPAFQAITASIQTSQGAALTQLAGQLTAKSAQLHNDLEDELYLAGGLGLLAVVVSVFVGLRFGGRFRSELTSLYESARQIAEERLPRLAERLRRGEDVDVAAEAPPLREGRITETASVARAFSTVQRTAVEAAAGQAALRKGLNQVFVSLSLRSQSLLHRQLGLLDEMERATGDPSALADLFQLDHLTTRMRRHAEGLLILAGSVPGRGWRDPVLLVDVLNAAIAEVEDYVRVDVATESADSVAGTAVSDVIHLLAELIENATSFSPPTTRVEVRGETVSHGYAIEIEDRGLGMSPEQIAMFNERLTNPPEFDLANSDQLGLFVAARLAQRQEIKVALRPSPFGGTTAIVLLPQSVIVSAREAYTTYGVTDPGEFPYEPGDLDGDGAGYPPPFGPTGRHHRFGTLPAADPVRPARLPQAGQTGPRPVHGAGSGAPGAVAPPGTPPPWGGVPAERPSRGDDRPDARVTEFPNVLTVSGTRPGLPRRSRGTNLAPRLRLQPDTGAAGAGRRGSAGSAQEPPDRSPEDAASRFSALQDGWQRARIEDIEYFNEEEDES